MSPDAPSVRSLLAPWIGGASAPAGADAPAVRSLLAFWLGGAASGDAEEPTPQDDAGGGRFVRPVRLPPQSRPLDQPEPPPGLRQPVEPDVDSRTAAAEALARDMAAARAIVRQLEARQPQQRAAIALRQALQAAEASTQREAAAAPPAADSARALAAARAEALAEAKRIRNRLRAAMLAALLLLQ
ncbi:MAG: hypothetical protein EKK62_04000 [Acidimicrobiia bacterium]|nr:MAG: hypothetical protein EKK62_04000 [Acidimicrobiia bacterium]